MVAVVVGVAVAVVVAVVVAVAFVMKKRSRKSKLKIVDSYVERQLWLEGMIHMENVIGNLYADFGVAIEYLINKEERHWGFDDEEAK